MNKIAAVVQARMGSSRVPGKAMLDLAGHPLIWHIIDRVRRVTSIETIILATTADPRNEPLIEFAKSCGLACVQSKNENDLADRLAKAFALSQTQYLLKVGGDCPLIDVTVLQKMVDRALKDGGDFISNRVKWSYPLGLSADVISRDATLWCDQNLIRPEDRELFALYIRDHTERFHVTSIEQEQDLSHHVWTVDEPEDVPFMRTIFDKLYREGEVFGMDDVLSFLKKNS